MSLIEILTQLNKEENIFSSFLVIRFFYVGLQSICMYLHYDIIYNDDPLNMLIAIFHFR